jgi:hypothetical protein
MSSRPSTAAPPRVAKRNTSRAVTALAPPADALQQHRVAHFVEHVATNRWKPSRRRRSPRARPPPRARDRRDAAAEPHVRGRAVRDAGARGAERATSSAWRMHHVACHTSSPTQPRRSASSTGPAAVARGSNALRRASPRDACARCTPFAARECGALAHEGIAKPRTANTARRRCASSRSANGVVVLSIARCVSLRIAGSSSTHESGGKPPCERPTDIEPRDAWKRRPISRATSTSSSTLQPFGHM